MTGPIDPARLATAITVPCTVQLLRAAPSRSAPWTRATVLDLVGDVALPVTPTRAGRVLIDARYGRTAEPRSLAAQLEAMERDPDAGYVIAPLEVLPAPALRVLAHPFSESAAFRSGKLWISSRGTVSDLHFDLAHNLFVQLGGTKRVTIAHRRYGPFVAPSGPFASIPNGARVDPERPDYARFPWSRLVRFESFELGAGDALVIPGGVWHHARSLSDSISVNFWWATGLHARLVRAASALKRAAKLSE